MFKILFEILTDPLGLPINIIWEYLIIAIINVIAFKIAWEASPGGFGGSTIHWVVRLIMFVIIWAIIYGVIVIAKWIFTNWKIVLCIVAGVVVLGIVIAVVVKQNLERRWNNASNEG